ncbi:MAG: tRNA nucleotidyltransferase [Erysipelotrichaceae bacterium]|nr:tRNA nucleotidyltransferase [Erysipelotrichaceae bacterium]
MKTFEENLFMTKRIAEEVATLGGRVFYVGGFVRDKLCNRENKDIDIEVHGISVSTLEGILDTLGKRMDRGESFGIYALKGYDIDIAMPRKEKLIGKGHKDFEVMVDPYLGYEKAARRRDFTLNALMMDVLSEEVIDGFGGLNDLKEGVLRHVDEVTFVEDPLRVLRAAQFASRFHYKVADETIKLCSTMDLSTLACERIMGELNKALLKSDKPSIFFEVLKEMNQLTYWFKEVEDLIGVPQNPKYHEEGDVYTHTMMVIDSASKYRELVTYQEGFMMSALVHDFGKPSTTKEIDGVLHSYGHEVEGLPVVETFLKRLDHNKNLRKYVLNMTQLHMQPNMITKDRTIKSTNHLFDKSIAPSDLIYLAKADDEGRITRMKRPDVDLQWERLKIYQEYMDRPYVTGEDLIKEGLKPKEGFSEYLAYSHKLRLAGVKKEDALKQTLAYAKKKRKSV